jgi:hypothetical protein
MQFAFRATEPKAWSAAFQATERVQAPIQCHHIRCVFGNPFRPVTHDLSWLTPAVVELAQAIYNDRAFDRMPKLADVLEAAGCTDADLLSHCRETGPHVRGCWAVDLVLGKE